MGKELKSSAYAPHSTPISSHLNTPPNPQNGNPKLTRFFIFATLTHLNEQVSADLFRDWLKHTENGFCPYRQCFSFALSSHQQTPESMYIDLNILTAQLTSRLNGPFPGIQLKLTLYPDDNTYLMVSCKRHTDQDDYKVSMDQLDQWLMECHSDPPACISTSIHKNLWAFLKEKGWHVGWLKNDPMGTVVVRRLS